MSLTQQAHQRILAHLATIGKNQFNVSIDATCGNGHDTVFLAKHTSDQVLGFDIQAAAIMQTQQRLEQCSYADKVTLQQRSHADMLSFCQQHHPAIVGQVDVIVFNLGYLPHSDKTIITQTKSTIAALTAAAQLLSQNGIISLLCYRGHEQGKEESDAVLGWLTQQQTLSYQVTHSTQESETTPFLVNIYPA